MYGAQGRMSVAQTIEKKLTEGLSPTYLDVVNESHQHNVPPGSESHFKVVIVSDAFVGASKVKRHQQVYGLLAQELKTGVHALALHTYHPQEWSERTAAPESPPCLGGSK